MAEEEESEAEGEFCILVGAGSMMREHRDGWGSSDPDGGTQKAFRGDSEEKEPIRIKTSCMIFQKCIFHTSTN